MHCYTQRKVVHPYLYIFDNRFSSIGVHLKREMLIETYKRLIVNVYPELWERTLKGTAQDSLVVCG